MKRPRRYEILTKVLDLSKSKVLFRFGTFKPKDWTIVKGTPEWTVSARQITGGGPDETTPAPRRLQRRSDIVGF